MIYKIFYCVLYIYTFETKRKKDEGRGQLVEFKMRNEEEIILNLK